MYSGHVYKYQRQLRISSISRKLEKTSVCLNFRYWNFSHSTEPWLCKYLMHHHLQIVIQGRIMLKNKSIYFSAICVNFPCEIEKFESEVVVLDILGTGFCFQGNHWHIIYAYRSWKSNICFFFMSNKFENCFTLVRNNIYW